MTVHPSTDRAKISKLTALYKTVTEIKSMARIIKAVRVLPPNTPEEALASLSGKDICDMLVACYLCTFEGVSRVLHVPSFCEGYVDYWKTGSAETFVQL